MLTQSQKHSLISQWDKANCVALDCLAYVRFYDPLSQWECYLYAMNPEDHNHVVCLINGFSISLESWNLEEISERYNSMGDHAVIDYEFIPIKVKRLIDRLR